MKKTLKSAGAVGLAAATILTGLSFGPAAASAAPADDIGSIGAPFAPVFPRATDWRAANGGSYGFDTFPNEAAARAGVVGAWRALTYKPQPGTFFLQGVNQDGNPTSCMAPQNFSGPKLGNWDNECDPNRSLWKLVDGKITSASAGSSYPGYYISSNSAQYWQTLAAPESGDPAAIFPDLHLLGGTVESIDLHARTATLSGTAIPGSKVLINGDRQIAVDEDGIWSAAVSGLALGVNTVTLEQYEGPGNKTDETTVDVDLAVQPVDAIVTLDADVTKMATLSGNAHPGATVVIRDADGAEIDRGPASPIDGTWSMELRAPNIGGDYTVSVHQVIDGEENGEITTTIAYGVAVTVTRPVPDAGHDGGSLTMRGTGEPDAQITVREQGHVTVIGSAKVLVNGTWNLATLDLDDRRHVLEVTQTGKGNNVTTSTTTINPENEGVAQPFALTAPQDGDTVIAPDNRVTFTGTGTTGDTVAIVNTYNGRVVTTTTIDAAGNWTGTGNVGFGVQNLKAVVTHGDVSTDHRLSITVNATAGVDLPYDLTNPADGSTVVAPDNRVTFTGTGATGARVILTAGTGRQVVNTLVDGNGNWTATGTLTHQYYELGTSYTRPGGTPVTGTTTLTVLATDAVILPFAIETPADGDTVIAPDNQVTFTGTGAAGATVELINDPGGSYERIVARTVVDNDGTWTATGYLSHQFYNLTYAHTPGDLGGDQADGITSLTVVAE